MVKVLQIGASTESGAIGGVEVFLLNYYKNMNHENVHFDFLFCSSNPLDGIKDDSLKSCNIFALGILKDKKKNIFMYINLIKQIREIIKQGHYDCVHVNSGGFPLQLCCAIALKPFSDIVKIAHSHTSGSLKTETGFKSNIKQIGYNASRFFIRNRYDYYFACSKLAGIRLFGKEGINSTKFRIINNAIELKKYEFNKEVRDKIRIEFGINSGTTVFGYVGRLSKSKNILFALDVFGGIIQHKKDCFFVIVGDGEEKENLQNRTKELHINDKVRFLGQRNDVPNILQGMDAFIFPSLYEGLSIVLIEAQAAGLKVYASNTISTEHSITDRVEYIDISVGIKPWVERINNSWREITKRGNTALAMEEAGYNVVLAGTNH